MSTVIDLFERHGYVLELLACVAATTWKLERQERFAARLTGILLAEACFTIVWEQVPHNLYTESLRTFLLWSIAAVGIRLCFRIAAAWAVFYAAHHLPGGQAAAECGVSHGPAVLGLEPVGLSGPFRAAVRGVLPDPHPAAAQPQSGHTARAHDDFYHGGLPAEHEHLRQPVQRL